MRATNDLQRNLNAIANVTRRIEQAILLWRELNVPDDYWDDLLTEL